MPFLSVLAQRAGQTSPDHIRVMIVDDDDLTREELGSYLAGEGFEIVGSASDGLQAFAEAAWVRPDVVLMDLRMPNMDGVATTNLIKAHFPQIPVVILTAFPSKDNRWAARLSGATSFLDKATPLPVLVETLRSAAHDPA
jgi:DNA-binding NarL/FixJ family response regulator